MRQNRRIQTPSPLGGSVDKTSPQPSGLPPGATEPKVGGLKRKRRGHPIHGMVNSREYYVWGNMKMRCYNKNDPSYKNYGGRGIIVSAEWHDFRNFYRDMGPMLVGYSI